MGFGVWGLGFGVWGLGLIGLGFGVCGLGWDLQQLCHQLALARVLERGVHVEIALVGPLRAVVVRVRGRGYR